MRSLVWATLAVLANIGLFFLLAHAQPAAKNRPAQEVWTVREVFQPAPPPRPPASDEEAPRSVPDQPASPQEAFPTTSFEAPTSEALLPRTSMPSFDIGSTGVGGGPPVPLPFGLPGGPLRSTRTGPPPATAPLSLEQVDQPPRPAATPLPPYPQWARSRRLTGVVTLRFTVDADGSVRDLAIEGVDGDERFGPIAVEAVAGWRFQPGVHEGRKVAVRVSQRVRFRLVE